MHKKNGDPEKFLALAKKLKEMISGLPPEEKSCTEIASNVALNVLCCLNFYYCFGILYSTDEEHFLTYTATITLSEARKNEDSHRVTRPYSTRAELGF